MMDLIPPEDAKRLAKRRENIMFAAGLIAFVAIIIGFLAWKDGYLIF